MENYGLPVKLEDIVEELERRGFKCVPAGDSVFFSHICYANTGGLEFRVCVAEKISSTIISSVLAEYLSLGCGKIVALEKDSDVEEKFPYVFAEVSPEPEHAEPWFAKFFGAKPVREPEVVEPRLPLGAEETVLVPLVDISLHLYSPSGFLTPPKSASVTVSFELVSGYPVFYAANVGLVPLSSICPSREHVRVLGQLVFHRQPRIPRRELLRVAGEIRGLKVSKGKVVSKPPIPPLRGVYPVSSAKKTVLHHGTIWAIPGDTEPDVSVVAELYGYAEFEENGRDKTYFYPVSVSKEARAFRIVDPVSGRKNPYLTLLMRRVVAKWKALSNM